MRLTDAIRGLGAVAVLVTLAACGGRTPVLSRVVSSGRYDLGSEELLDALAAAREGAREPDELERARVRLEALRPSYPHNMPLAALLQDIELELLKSGASIPGIEAGVETPEAALRNRYWNAANSAEGVDPYAAAADWVLAARLENDRAAALRSLDKALDLDPDCIWAHYGRANVLMRGRQSDGARAAIERALALDEGHLPTRRLYAAYLARARQDALATAELTAWIEDSSGRPEFSAEQRVAAYVDRALLLILRGKASEAVLSLKPLADEGLELDWRGESVLVAAFDEGGRWRSARLSASRASAKGEGEVFPKVQAALLCEKRARGGDIAARVEARELWNEVVASTDPETLTEKGLEVPEGAFLWNMMATVHLERLANGDGEVGE